MATKSRKSWGCRCRLEKLTYIILHPQKLCSLHVWTLDFNPLLTLLPIQGTCLLVIRRFVSTSKKKIKTVYHPLHFSAKCWQHGASLQPVARSRERRRGLHRGGCLGARLPQPGSPPHHRLRPLGLQGHPTPPLDAGQPFGGAADNHSRLK